ncbi:MAG: hypothetical protein P0Y56_14400 [Candidatus Andeanibacterium colombiense]|uniref:Phage shock protein B n=1 Tax=Candidatus Andeanibacterium colombiense TaxID=3121345 RepID=A0AAJ5X7X8_9SPHN|nr:MAG: hypothetical protein P0Y56_14400 [Sphingomonadaceae bacterium]
MDMFSFVPFAPFLMIVGIVWVRSRAKLEEKRIEAGLGDNGANDLRRENRIGELEERVRVLERIVTDGGYELAHKIEALRDMRVPAGEMPREQTRV